MPTPKSLEILKNKMVHLHFSKVKLLKSKIWNVYKFRFSFDPQIKTHASVCPQTTCRILSPALFSWKPKKPLNVLAGSHFLPSVIFLPF